MKLRLPQRLANQLVLLLLLTLAIAQIFTLMFFLSKDDYINERIDKNLMIKRIAQTTNALEEVPIKYHMRIVRSVSVFRVHFQLTDQSLVAEVDALPPQSDKMVLLKEMLNKQYPEVFIQTFEVPSYRVFSMAKYTMQYLNHKLLNGPPPLDKNKLMTVSIQIRKNKWLSMDVYGKENFPIWAMSALVSLLLMSVTLVVIVITVVKRITRPLKELANKAKALGEGENVEPIEVAGPDDIKDAITAFNAMQSRLNDVLVHRTRSLAAMSHDLRTPLTSLRLHAEFIPDIDLQDKVIEKLDEMEAIAKSTIDFAKQDSWSEPMRVVELGSLIESICFDLQDINQAVDFNIHGRLPFKCRPIALKRAITNLIENGIKYGEQVFVEVFDNVDEIKILISDQGEGIPESEHSRIFQAFERLEGSRNIDSGGMGLGMTIALTVVQAHGGQIKLNNREPKGMDVIVLLPKSTSLRGN